MNIERKTIKLIHADMVEALNAIAAKHGLSVTVNGGSFDTGAWYRPRVEFKQEGADAREFDTQARYLGLPGAFHFGGHFVYNGVSYEMVSWRPRAWKSLVARNTGNGKLYAFTIAVVKAALGIKSMPESLPMLTEEVR